jgi:hypothetical protein
MLLKLNIEPYGENKWIEQLVKHIPHIESSIEDCDYIVSTKFSWGVTDSTLIQDVLYSYKDILKKVIIFLVSDYNEPVEIPKNIIFFRTGFYKSKKKSNEYLLPYPGTIADLHNEPSFTPLGKINQYPIVGFCGFIHSHPTRLKFINKLKSIPKIKNNFVIKDQYWGGNPHNINTINDFVNNIKNSHITLCIRGTGNWSARFYQVLYLGRIPLFINSDMMLPFEDKINWKDIIIYCDSIYNMVENIRMFWLTKDIIQAQIKCKEIYDTYLAPEKWCKIITDEILIPNK